MALQPAANPVGRLALSSVYNTEYISRRMREQSIAPSIGQLIINPVPIDEAETYTYQVAIDEPIDPDLIQIVAPGDAAPEAAFGTTHVQITGDKRGLRVFVLDETRNKLMRTVDKGVRKLRQAHVRYWSRQAIDQFSSITNLGNGVPGDNATPHSLENWDLHTGSFRGQTPDPGPLWSVMSRSAVRDFRADIISNAAAIFGTNVSTSARDALATNQPGIFREFDGFMHYESDEVPAGDTTGFTCAMGVGGENAGIEYPEWEEIEVEFQRAASRFGTWIVTGLTSGIGIVAQQNLYAYVVRG